MKRKKNDWKRILGSQKGSAAVLICFMFSALVVAAAVIIDCGGWEVSKAYGERLTFLACRSVFAQYDKNLWEDYGLLAYCGTAEDVEKEVEAYLHMMGRKEASQKGENHLMFDVLPVSVEVNTPGGTLINKELVREQIVELMKVQSVSEGLMFAFGFSEAADLFREKREAAKNGLEEEERMKEAAKAAAREAEEKETESDDEEGSGGEPVEIPKRETVSFPQNTSFQPEESPKGQRILRNESLKATLPSNGYGKSFSLPEIRMKSEEEMMKLGEQAESVLESFSQMGETILDRYLIDQYILTYMNSATKEGKKETFFGNEVEYILCGSNSDQENYQSVQIRLFLLRTGLNLIHIYNDPEKRALTLEAAAAISGPFAAGPVQFLICISWASFEAKNDVKVLMDGGKIPLIKNSSQWASSLDALFGRTKEAGGGGSGEGLNYEGYLGIFLAVQGEDEKLLRIMDLIQINMKGRYRDSFDLRTCISRFEITVTFSRKQYTIQSGISLMMGDTFTVQGVHSYD